jgi:hypothetical protein
MKLLTKAQIAAKKLDKAHDAHFAAFPVVITTYDLIIKDRPVLGGELPYTPEFRWRYMPTTMENTIETYPKP